MVTYAERRDIIEKWFKEFSKDEDQISLDVDIMDEKQLKLSCGDGLIVFSFENNENSDSNQSIIKIISEGNDKFVKKLVQKTIAAITSDTASLSSKFLQSNLNNILLKFAETAKIMAIDSANSDGEDYDSGDKDDNEVFDYQYDDDNNNEVQVSGGISNDWLTEHYMKKKWASKEIDLRAKKELLADKNDKNPLPKASSKTVDLFSPGASSKALTNDLLSLIHQSEDLAYTVLPVDDDIHNWTVKLNNVRADTLLAQDLAMLDDAFDYSYIELQLHFAMDVYPFYPPLVTIIRPRFEGFMLGKITTLKCLQLTHWDPLFGTIDIIQTIRKELEDNGRIDYQSLSNSLITHPNGSYSTLEHILLKLGLVTEIVPRMQQISEKRENVLKKIDSGSIKKQRRVQEGWEAERTENSPKGTDVKAEVKTGKDLSEVKTKLGGGISLPAKEDVPGSKNEGKWDINLHQKAQAEKDRLLRDLLTQLLSELNENISALASNTVNKNNKNNKNDKSIYVDLTGDDSGSSSSGNSSSNSGMSCSSSSSSSSSSNRSRFKCESCDTEKQDANNLFTWNHLQDILEGSCLIPLLEIHLKDQSLLEIEWHSDLYFLVFKVLQLLADNEIFAPLLLHLEAQECSIADLILKNFSHRLDVYTKISDLTSNTVPIAPRIIQTLLPGIGEGTKQANTTLADEGKSEEDLETSDSLMLFMKLVVDKVRLATQILGSERNVSKGFLSDFSSTVSGIRRNIGEILKIGDDSRDLVSEYAGKSDSGGNGSSSSSSSSSSNSSSTSNDNEAEYKAKMLPLQYGENDVLSSYHYRANLLTSNMGSNVKSRVKRLAQEHSDLSHSLPVSLSSSVWLRCSAERMDAVQFMISGPEDTPYSNGLFLFDSFFPENYPQHAPKVNLQTTGRGTVRFNPNLYNCGKVCLSLLGTWPGQTEEGWVASNSTFLQVIVSIQSLILVPDPYFNEPGYEGTMGSSNGQKASEAYNLNLREQTIRWGMIDVLTNPPTGFEEIIRTHFKLKRECIIELVEKWESLAPKSKRETFTSLKSTLISAIAHL